MRARPTSPTPPQDPTLPPVVSEGSFRGEEKVFDYQPGDIVGEVEGKPRKTKKPKDDRVMSDGPRRTSYLPVFIGGLIALGLVAFRFFSPAPAPESVLNAYFGSKIMEITGVKPNGSSVNINSWVVMSRIGGQEVWLASAPVVDSCAHAGLMDYVRHKFIGWKAWSCKVSYGVQHGTSKNSGMSWESDGSEPALITRREVFDLGPNGWYCASCVRVNISTGRPEDLDGAVDITYYRQGVCEALDNGGISTAAVPTFGSRKVVSCTKEPLNGSCVDDDVIRSCKNDKTKEGGV